MEQIGARAKNFQMLEPGLENSDDWSRNLKFEFRVRWNDRSWKRYSIPAYFYDKIFDGVFQDKRFSTPLLKCGSSTRQRHAPIFRTIRCTQNPLVTSKIESAPYNAVRLTCESRCTFSPGTKFVVNGAIYLISSYDFFVNRPSCCVTNQQLQWTASQSSSHITATPQARARLFHSIRV